MSVPARTWVPILLWLAPGCSAPGQGPCGRPAIVDGSDGPLSVGANLRVFDDQRYVVHVSERAARTPEDASVLVAVHGFTGTYDDCQGKAAVWRQLDDWRATADDNGWVVVAPQFDETLFDWFQVLNLPRVSDYGPRADVTLHGILDDTAGRLPGLDVATFGMAGFSAGGQFSHRYALLHPDRVVALASGGSGSWTYADSTVDYPYGTGALTPLRPSLDAWCSPDSFFYVGGDDDGSDPYFSDCDLDWSAVCAQQGATRTERAEGFHASVLAQADRQGLACSPRFEVYEGVGHATPEEVDDDVRAFLAERL